MKKHEFFAGLKIKSNEPIDDRLYVDAITVDALKSIFGDYGQYGFANAVLFNRADNKFWYQSAWATAVDSVTVAKWSAVGLNAISFPAWLDSETYGVGSCITFTDSGNNTGFFIGLSSIAANESPESDANLWLNVSASQSVTATVLFEQIDHRLDPDTASTHTISHEVSEVVTDNGSRIPNINIWGDFGERVSGNIVWHKVEPAFRVYTEAGTLNCEVAFTGDLSGLHYDAAQTTEKNILITFSL